MALHGAVTSAGNRTLPGWHHPFYGYEADSPHREKRRTVETFGFQSHSTSISWEEGSTVPAPQPRLGGPEPPIR